MLGLPDNITACLFDMDGVITQTAKVHDAAWKEMFDGFLRDWSTALGWNRREPGPEVPADVVAAVAGRYEALYRRITGA